MLIDLKTLLDTRIRATDGVIGEVKDLYFDDARWGIRYFVVEAGSWLSARRILISPVSLATLTGPKPGLSVTLNKAQIENSPSIDTDQPVSRQQELDYLRYYGYAFYWSGGGLWGRGAHPGSLLTGLDAESSASLDRSERLRNARRDAEDDAAHRPRRDHHLRSCTTVMAYQVHALDGDVGHVAGFLLDDMNWAIRYLVVETGHWWQGRKVLIAPQWIGEIRWDDNKVVVGVSRDKIKTALPYSADLLTSRGLESHWHDHFETDGHWARDVSLENPELRAPPLEDRNQ
jgi:hypothetical protein